jgi:hypothetical protein
MHLAKNQTVASRHLGVSGRDTWTHPQSNGSDDVYDYVTMMLSCSAAVRLRPCRLTHTRSLHRSAVLLYIDQEPIFEGVPPDVSKLIYHHAHQPQTAVSLQALMRTGRGEFLHKTYKDEVATKDEAVATERVLKQVCIVGNIYISIVSVSIIDSHIFIRSLASYEENCPFDWLIAFKTWNEFHT